jgi:hypothetical protein
MGARMSELVDQPRRNFLIGCGVLGLAAANGGPAIAQDQRFPRETREKCATCQFWGGTRSLSRDRRTVIASGTGLCSNPQSPAYRRQTRPDQGARVWQMWEALS